MEQIEVPPYAPAMLESLRAIGYSFESALADIVDNSITAQATKVEVRYPPESAERLSIIDNGNGMAPGELVEAMRHGGLGPAMARSAEDLGRFGLGMKTASLSQCRRLTVVTCQGGVVSGAVWDLDVIARTGKWTLGILTDSDASQVPHTEALVQRRDNGTVVTWEKLDRATAGEAAPGKALSRLVNRSRDHLGLAFHRFIRPSTQLGIEILVNNDPVDPVDPFLKSHRSTQRLPRQVLDVEGGRVTFDPYILPHISKMSAADRALAGGEEGLRSQQGFYVYRNRRLIIHGTWFRLLRREELTKLARVQVDIPNTLDYLWALDVKKSTAYPPEAVRVGLAQVVEQIADTSRRVYKYRGHRASRDPETRIWERVELRDGIEYRINREHPLTQGVRDGLEGVDQQLFEALLRASEMAIPVDAIYADMASERRVQPAPNSDDLEASLENLARRMVEAVSGEPEATMRLLDSIVSIEPFSTHVDITKRVIARIRDAI